jgi:hypothetical protein
MLSSFGTPIPLQSVFGGVVLETRSLAGSTKGKSWKYGGSPKEHSKSPSSSEGGSEYVSIVGADSIVITYFIEDSGGQGQGTGLPDGWTAEVWDRIWSEALKSKPGGINVGRHSAYVKESEMNDNESENSSRASTDGSTTSSSQLYNVAWRAKGEPKHLYYVFNQPNAAGKDKLFSAEFVILAVSYVIVFLYISLVLGKVELVKSKFGLGFSAVVMVFSSLLMSVGLSSMMGVTTSLVPWYGTTNCLGVIAT